MKRSIKVGVNLYNEFHASIESFLNFLHRMKIDYVEIGKDWIPTRKEVGEFRDLLEIYQLGATLHITGDYNLAELNSEKRKRNVLGVLGDLSACYDLNIKTCVLHCGWVLNHDKLSQAYKRFEESYKTIAHFAEELGVRICLENQCSNSKKHYIFQDHGDIDKLCESVDSEAIFFVLDVGHLGRLNKSLDKMISRMDERLVEIHLHDYNQWDEDHLPLGTGILDKERLVKLIESKNPLVTIENRSVKDVRESILYLRSL